MKKLVLELEYMNGPILKDKFDIQRSELCTGIEQVDADEYLNTLNEEIQEVYTALFRFDEKEEAVLFDDVAAKGAKEWFLSKMNELSKYLKSINDGSFCIEDRVTEYLKKL
ncbi:MAG: hypothetical protein Q4B86_04805 [Eubacteriales bacterium]|nr:hypothetical protein [Eubacteriales bacterium]